MNNLDIIEISKEFIQSSEYNYISKNDAITEELVGMKIFDNPIFAFGSAEDNGFTLLKAPSVIGEHFILPKEWLPEANTVISYFLPFTDEIIKSNRIDKHWPSNGWLHGRIEGQKFLMEFSKYLCSKLVEEGYDSVVPILDKRFKSFDFTSNWSERHVAFVCGLGTFGLSKGIITEKGMAGRLGSIVTTLKLDIRDKNYTDVYEYCTMCGACVKKCPVGAISLEKGKNHKMCSELLDITKEKYKPRYGCGKCQVSVPCERRIPKLDPKIIQAIDEVSNIPLV